MQLEIGDVAWIEEHPVYKGIVVRDVLGTLAHAVGITDTNLWRIEKAEPGRRGYTESFVLDMLAQLLGCTQMGIERVLLESDNSLPEKRRYIVRRFVRSRCRNVEFFDEEEVEKSRKPKGRVIKRVRETRKVG